ncbi:MAG: tyrosine-type recombinase/integrase [Anaerolineales bacterium]|nr:tyrosine-type recombinase/integrase [Anaerolineales bacterium]
MCSLRLVPKENHLIREAFIDFILSRQAALLSPSTIEFYKYTAGFFVDYIISQGVFEPEEISTNLVRAYLIEVNNRGVADATVHAHARGTRAFLSFLNEDGYISTPINIKMPCVEQKKMRVLSPDEMKQILKVCKKPRDKALILFLIDSGLRRSEACSLNWIDVDIPSGVVNIRRSKNKKARSVFIGVKTRRALLRYRRTISHDDIDPVFQTQADTRLKPSGLRQVIRRMSEKSGISFSAHDLRRTFATLSLKAGMNVLHLQSLLGHSSLEMTRRYVQMVKDDLSEAHRSHGPIDTFLNK